jgi:hypothetical protein
MLRIQSQANDLALILDRPQLSELVSGMSGTHTCGSHLLVRHMFYASDIYDTFSNFQGRILTSFPYNFQYILVL